MEEHPDVGDDTAWVSQYSLYDALSDAYKKLLDGLHAVHTSRPQCPPHTLIQQGKTTLTQTLYGVTRCGKLFILPNYCLAGAK
ncbi:Taurine catabolism dioxygenase TauD TfdA family protein [Aspergillus parasiticus SU-1]|uniref:TauD/TfdA-like domain-containing protein n=2 Tax=Aspergillus parasiticus TaxID=5067 RepID=A0A5N6DT27_ASPPA|nr:hypothetical protein BDV34DRAFT_190629 [Aspergillus parasiticus]KJK62372.1 Taurine catabolism dioxygenase TauD TfdA family protein [Aspergillus parasiticus SU-1]